MKKVSVWTYDPKSSSARLLREALNALGGLPKKGPGNVIVCWGKAPDDIAHYGYVVNHPSVVRRALNKARAFRYLEAAGVRVPSWTTSIEEARKLGRTARLVARRVLTGKDGDGISIVPVGGELSADDKLWTVLVPRQAEYRIHVVNGEVVDNMKKLRENGFRANEIATTSNGYFFQKTGVVAPDNVKSEAVKAVKALEMHFGGVDVLLGEDNQAYVLEVNSAPELGSNTVRPFAQAIQRIIERIGT